MDHRTRTFEGTLARWNVTLLLGIASPRYNSGVSGHDNDIETEVPATFGQHGRLLVLKPHEVAIRSPEGQRYLRERHNAVMEHLKAYPSLRKHVFTETWGEGFQKKWQSDPGTLASFRYPSFYLEPFQLEVGIWPKDYLARADTGVAFLVERAPRRN